ncbi:MAG: HoxA-like transcriptional regulator [Haloquadratum walsbyi J07HQW1]|uniref:HoxA-like transcriptional regulator n=1 Tax=Haloquadratum walsbyi J07HQW1 TaxID=1238424 RepID=U1PGB4_9EURY|nr:MAG: HoxA-like transcriptional regulator [Haloquadratum walsbyi J07HQW1]
MSTPATRTSEENPTVLIADDESALTDSVALWLADQYDVRTAYTGTEAVDMYDASVDIVIVDRRMPGLSGDEVCTQLQDRAGNPKMILLTASSINHSHWSHTHDYTTVNQSDLSLFDGRIQKPVSKTDLLDTLGNIATDGSAE